MGSPVRDPGVQEARGLLQALKGAEGRGSSRGSELGLLCVILGLDPWRIRRGSWLHA